MNDLFAEGIFLISALGTVVVMLLVIRKKSCKKTDENAAKTKKIIKYSSENSAQLYLN